MAFVPTTSVFLGTPVESRATCRNVKPRFSAVRMTATSPKTTSTVPADDSGNPTRIEVPRFTRVPLKKGQPFTFVRWFKDDFEPSPYFSGLTGAGVRVAVLDTGIDQNHPALKNRIDYKASRNYLPEVDATGSPSGPVDPDAWQDTNGHGTHCAGIIAAEPARAPMYGVAPGATIVAKRVIPGFAPDLSAAIRDAVAEGCHVVSMSLGFPYVREVLVEDFDGLYKTCMDALAKGVIIVAAAGNYGVNRFGFRDRSNTISPPGCYGSVITVASHDDAGNKSSFSSYGAELDFMAPGEVISTWPLDVPKTRADGPRTIGIPGYSALQGTSMAAPLVAGIAALLVEAADRYKRGEITGLSPQLLSDLRETGFDARNCYEVHEMLRRLSDNPDLHNREVGYGKLTRAYELVKEDIEEDI